MPYTESLKEFDFRPIIQQAQAAIPPGIRRRLSISVSLNYPMPIGFYIANNVFGKMSLQEKGKEESICYCKGKEEFYGMADCAHTITTNPRILQQDFPNMFDLCLKRRKISYSTSEGD